MKPSSRSRIARALGFSGHDGDTGVREDYHHSQFTPFAPLVELPDAYQSGGRPGRHRRSTSVPSFSGHYANINRKEYMSVVPVDTQKGRRSSVSSLPSALGASITEQSLGAPSSQARDKQSPSSRDHSTRTIPAKETTSFGSFLRKPFFWSRRGKEERKTSLFQPRVSDTSVRSRSITAHERPRLMPRKEQPPFRSHKTTSESRPPALPQQEIPNLPLPGSLNVDCERVKEVHGNCKRCFKNREDSSDDLTNRRTLNVNLHPMAHFPEPLYRDGTIQIMSPVLYWLSPLRHLRRLKLTGMTRSYQREIWRAVWLNPELKYLTLEMEERPLLNEGMKNAVVIQEDWQPSFADQAKRLYQ